MKIEQIRDYNVTDYKISGYGSKPIFFTICKTDGFGETQIDWEFFCAGMTLALRCDDARWCVEYEMDNHPFENNGILNDADEALRMIEDFFNECKKL